MQYVFVAIVLLVAACLFVWREVPLQRMRRAVRTKLKELDDQRKSLPPTIVAWLAHFDANELQAFEDEAGNDPAALKRAVVDRTVAKLVLARLHHYWVAPTNEVSEDDCVSQFGAAIPYLFPHFRPVTDVYLRKTISRFLSETTPLSEAEIKARAEKFKLKADPKNKPDVCARFETKTSYAASTKRGTTDVVLVVEAKGRYEEVNETVIEEAVSYVYDLYRLIASKTPVHFECLAVAERIAPSLNVPHLQLVGFGPSTISVTPTTWRDLYEKALRNSRIDPLKVPSVISLYE